MSKPVRTADVALSYNARDITADITPFLESFEYTDVVDGKETDSLTLGLDDSQGLFIGEWFPERGATIEATLTCRDWPGGKVLNCGTFEIDSPGFSGPPSICRISAVAVGITTTLRRERVSKAWDNINVKELAQEVSAKHGFDLVYPSAVNPLIDHFDQREQSDMELLSTLCENYGFVLRVTRKSIVILEQKMMDNREPTIWFTRGQNGYISHDFQVDSTDIYTACELKYFDPRDRLFLHYRYDAPTSTWSGVKPPSGYVLKLKERCSCQAEAEIRAKAALREKNKREVTGTLVYVGDPEIRAGEVAGLLDFGRFDSGRFLVERVRHARDQQGGYTSTVQLRGTVGY
ncbi:MAG: hypothetical protein LUC93_03045 [Planctomycetaceae bacterium]|nr:hypothetical protein [Planctomycetaceae bacterium]